MKYLNIKILSVCVLLPFVLNIAVNFCALSFFSGYGGFPKFLVEKPIKFIFLLANWPSMLLKIYPYRLSPQGEVIYEMFEWVNLRISAVNMLGWGLIGLLCGFVIKKYRKQSSQSPS